MKPAVLAILFVWLSGFSVFGQEPKLMLPIGHTDEVNSACFSPDGKKVVTASEDYSAKIWDAQTGALLVELKGHESSVKSACFSPDGKKILTASTDNSAKIWDTQTGTLLVDLGSFLHSGHILALGASGCFSPDGKKILTTSGDDTAKIWDAQTGASLIDLNVGANHHPVFSYQINSRCFAPDGKKVVTTSHDNTAKIWDGQNGALLFTLKGNSQRDTILKWGTFNDDINSVCFSPDGKKILTAEIDGSTKTWDAETGVLLAVLKGNAYKDTRFDWLTFNRGYRNSAFFSPDSKKILTTEDTSKIWDAQTGMLLAVLKGSTHFPYSPQFSPDGKKIVAQDGQIWDAQTGELLVDLDIGNFHYHLLQANSICFSPDSKKILTSSGDGTAKIWDAQTGALLTDLKGHTLSALGICFSKDGKKIITASSDDRVKIWDAKTGALRTSLKGYTVSVLSACFSPDGKKTKTAFWDQPAQTSNSQSTELLKYFKGINNNGERICFSPDGIKFVTSSIYDDTVKIQDSYTGLKIALIKEHRVNSTCFSPDSKMVLTASEDHTAKIWDARTGDLLIDLKGHAKPVLSAYFSPDGKKIVTASADSTAKIWDAKNGALLVDLNIKDPFAAEECYSARFSPDGNEVVTVSGEVAKIWDARSGALLAELNSPSYFINSVSFSPDGKKIVTITTENAIDNTIKIWDAQNGALLTSMEEYTGWINNMCFFPDGKKIVTTSRDNTCKVWDIETGKKLYTFFAVDSTDYLVTDPYGRYDGTAAARKLLYFTCGTEVISLDQVKDQLWVPNLVERINKGDSINAKKLSDLDICGLIPHVQREEKSGYHFMIIPQRGGLGETVLAVNGIEVKRYKPAQLIQTGNGFELNIPKQELTPYFIAGRQNPVTVKAYTAKNDIPSRMAQAMQDETAKKAEAPNLYAVMIGVSDYKSPELQLKYAAKDAADISKAVASSARKLLNTDSREHVYMYNLTTNNEHYQMPEKIAIKNIFTEIGKKATANDILLIFFAGHGVSSGEQKQFYFLTADASQATATEAPAEVGISTKELSEWMKPSIIKAQKRILILDACNSGQAINEMVKIGNNGQNYVAARNDDKSEQIKAIDKLNERSGLFILAASASNQNAYEMGRYSQGLLTYALLKAIKQEPDILEDNKYLNVSRWFNAAEKTVSDIVGQTGDRQEPQIVSAGNFNIGVVDQEVMTGIKLADEKSLFTASNFQNSDDAIMYDDLGLNALLDNHLNEMATRGDNNSISYIPGSVSPDAYSLSGRYEIKGDSLTIKVNIRQSKEIKYNFEIKGKREELNTLAGQVLGQATNWVAAHR